jgi:hypothetical protein
MRLTGHGRRGDNAAMSKEAAGEDTTTGGDVPAGGVTWSDL